MDIFFLSNECYRNPNIKGIQISSLFPYFADNCLCLTKYVWSNFILLFDSLVIGLQHKYLKLLYSGSCLHQFLKSDISKKKY